MPGGPNTTAGARTSASPTTPPSPGGSGHAPPPDTPPDAHNPRRYHRAEDPAPEPHRFAVEGTMGQHAPAPYRDQQNQHDRAEAENLHHEIGEDRAGIA